MTTKRPTARRLHGLLMHADRAIYAIDRSLSDGGIDLLPADAEEVILESAAWLWAVVDNIGALDGKRLRLTPDEKRSRRAVQEREKAATGGAS